MAETVISVRDLVKTYVVGDIEVKALRGASLDIYPGEFVAVTGPSGSGKSTLMHILGCLDVPTSGVFRLAGHDVQSLDENQLSDVRNIFIGFVFQQFNLLARTSAVENVELPLIYAGTGGRERHERAVAALERVGLGNRLHHHPNQLSGGQQQRVAIARAIVNRPRVILADEPTGALDSRTSIEVMSLFQELWRSGITIMVVTHEPDIAEFASRVIVMRDGRVLSDRRQEPKRAAHAEAAE
jgi:putative ABC transport system ATP-binding protein